MAPRPRSAPLRGRGLFCSPETPSTREPSTPATGRSASSSQLAGSTLQETRTCLGASPEPASAVAKAFGAEKALEDLLRSLGLDWHLSLPPGSLACAAREARCRSTGEKQVEICVVALSPQEEVLPVRIGGGFNLVASRRQQDSKPQLPQEPADGSETSRYRYGVALVGKDRAVRGDRQPLRSLVHQPPESCRAFRVLPTRPNSELAAAQLARELQGLREDVAAMPGVQAQEAVGLPLVGAVSRLLHALGLDSSGRWSASMPEVVAGSFENRRAELCFISVPLLPAIEKRQERAREWPSAAETTRRDVTILPAPAADSALQRVLQRISQQKLAMLRLVMQSWKGLLSEERSAGRRWRSAPRTAGTVEEAKEILSRLSVGSAAASSLAIQRGPAPSQEGSRALHLLLFDWLRRTLRRRLSLRTLRAAFASWKATEAAGSHKLAVPPPKGEAEAADEACGPTRIPAADQACGPAPRGKSPPQSGEREQREFAVQVDLGGWRPAARGPESTAAIVQVEQAAGAERRQDCGAQVAPSVSSSAAQAAPSCSDFCAMALPETCDRGLQLISPPLLEAGTQVAPHVRTAQVQTAPDVRVSEVQTVVNACCAEVQTDYSPCDSAVSQRLEDMRAALDAAKTRAAGLEAQAARADAAVRAMRIGGRQAESAARKAGEGFASLQTFIAAVVSDGERLEGLATASEKCADLLLQEESAKAAEAAQGAAKGMPELCSVVKGLRARLRQAEREADAGQKSLELLLAQDPSAKTAAEAAPGQHLAVWRRVEDLRRRLEKAGKEAKGAQASLTQMSHCIGQLEHRVAGLRAAVVSGERTGANGESGREDDDIAQLHEAFAALRLGAERREMEAEELRARLVALRSQEQFQEHLALRHGVAALARGCDLSESGAKQLGCSVLQLQRRLLGLREERGHAEAAAKELRSEVETLKGKLEAAKQGVWKPLPSAPKGLFLFRKPSIQCSSCGGWAPQELEVLERVVERQVEAACHSACHSAVSLCSLATGWDSSLAEGEASKSTGRESVLSLRKRTIVRSSCTRESLEMEPLAMSPHQTWEGSWEGAPAV